MGCSLALPGLWPNMVIVLVVFISFVFFCFFWWPLYKKQIAGAGFKWKTFSFLNSRPAHLKNRHILQDLRKRWRNELRKKVPLGRGDQLRLLILRADMKVITADWSGSQVAQLESMRLHQLQTHETNHWYFWGDLEIVFFPLRTHGFSMVCFIFSENACLYCLYW